MGEHFSHAFGVHLRDFFIYVTFIRPRVRCVPGQIPGRCAELVVKVVELSFAVLQPGASLL